MNHENNSNYIEICPTCNESFYYSEEETWFDDKSCGYSVKLVKCPHCGGISRIKYYEDSNLDVNNDKRFYEYKK